MNIKKPLTALIAIALLASVFAAAPAAAHQSQDCTVGQQNSQTNLGNVNTDLNLNAGNAAASAPVLSPDADSDARANQIIEDNNDAFQSQSNYVNC